jgi:hypothetical protein
VQGGDAAVSSDDNLQDMPTASSVHTESQTHHARESFSALLGNTTSVSPNSANNLWGASLMSPGPSWLVGYDFDLEALHIGLYDSWRHRTFSNLK